MADDPLAKLVRRADAVAATASALVARAIREIRGELANLSKELDLAGSANARERAYAMVRRRMARLSRRLAALLEAQNEAAARGAARAASGMAGVEVRYSAERAEAICELVTPAQGENLAAVFTDRMGAGVIDALREATVGALRDQAVAGGSMKDLARDMAERWSGAAGGEAPRFVDAAGRTWDTATYFQMSARTNTMRVYNDCLMDGVARATGGDLFRVSRHGGDPHCACAAWQGVIYSYSGRTKGFPTYDDVRRGGCFHPNCVHAPEAVDETAHRDEIELQRAVPFDPDAADDPDAQDERKYRIDQARKMRDNPGMTQEAARVAVDRDNLAAAIRFGLVRADAGNLVAEMTDAQVAALCPNGNPPRFEAVKKVRGGTRKEPKYEPERWNRGSRGGVVHVRRDADLAHILGVCNVNDAGGKVGGWTPQTDLEKATDTLMAQIGAKRTKERKDPLKSNPKFGDYRADDPNMAFCINCQRCVPTAEARFRGYDVTALPRQTVLHRGRIVGDDKDELYSGIDRTNDAEFFFPTFKDAQPISYRREEDIEAKMREWGDGSRAQITCKWKGRKSGGHTFMVVQENGKTRFIDPQTGSEDCAWYFRDIKRDRKYNFFARIDNLFMNDRMKLCCKP